MDLGDQREISFKHIRDFVKRGHNDRGEVWMHVLRTEQESVVVSCRGCGLGEGSQHSGSECKAPVYLRIEFLSLRSTSSPTGMKTCYM